MKKKYLFALLIFLQGFFLFGQKHEIGIFGGVSIYQGDLVFNTLSTEGSKFGSSIFYRNHQTKKIALKGALSIGKYMGADSFFPNEIPTRNFSFETEYIDFSVGVEYLFLGGANNFGKFKKYFSPYVHLGLGGVYANPSVTASGTTELDPEDLEHSKLHFMVPISVGLKLIVTERIGIDIELSARTAFSDYLDGISKSANPDKNDWYYLLGLNIGYQIGNIDIVSGG